MFLDFCKYKQCCKQPWMCMFAQLSKLAVRGIFRNGIAGLQSSYIFSLTIYIPKSICKVVVQIKFLTEDTSSRCSILLPIHHIVRHCKLRNSISLWSFLFPWLLMWLGIFHTCIGHLGFLFSDSLWRNLSYFVHPFLFPEGWLLSVSWNKFP